MKLPILTTLFLTLLAGCPESPNTGAGFKPANITLKEFGEFKELQDDKLTFTDSSGTEWIAPKGTLTDGASVPRLALPITDGRWDSGFLKAAVVHDAYCQEENKTRTPEQYRQKPWQSVHKMFYEASITGGTPPLTAKIMFAAVWLAGPRWDEPDRELQDVPSDALTRGFAGYETWIAEKNPSIEEITADLDRREPLILDLFKLETGIQEALKNGDLPRANALLGREDLLLERELAHSPNDSMLLNYKGFLHKNQAEVYRRSDVAEKVTLELLNSERAFNAVIEYTPMDPSALLGLGNISMMRGDRVRGEEFVRRALLVAPGFDAARRDLARIERMDIDEFNEPVAPE